MTTRYQIMRMSPIYHWSLDGLIGSKTSPASPMTYLTEALAGKLCARLSIEEERIGGDDYFYVATTDAPSVVRYGRAEPDPYWEEVPF